MANILIRINQAESHAQAVGNTRARHMSWISETHTLLFKEALDPNNEDDFGTPMLLPSLIGNGMGLRVAQASHQLDLWTPVRFNYATDTWVGALADTGENLSVGVVVNIVDASTFDVAFFGSYDVGDSNLPSGPLYLSPTISGAYYGTTAPTEGIPQIVARRTGSRLVVCPTSGIRGVDGKRGVPGLPGLPGADGSEWFSGSGVPSSDLGKAGSFYLNGVTGDVYEKTFSGWIFSVNIKGPKGDAADLSDHIAAANPHPQYALESVLAGSLANKADLIGGIVPSSQLPPAVDPIDEFDTLALFPAVGALNRIYLALDTNLAYRWSGSQYTEISPSLALGETLATAYRGDLGKIAFEHSQATGNPHGTAINDIEGLLNELAKKLDSYGVNGPLQIILPTGEVFDVSMNKWIEGNEGNFAPYITMGNAQGEMVGLSAQKQADGGKARLLLLSHYGAQIVYRHWNSSTSSMEYRTIEIPINDEETGHTLATREWTVSHDGVPVSRSGSGTTEDNAHTVTQTGTSGTETVPAASGSGRRITYIFYSNTGSWVLDPVGRSGIDGQSTYMMLPGEAFTLVDVAPGLWKRTVIDRKTVTPSFVTTTPFNASWVTRYLTLTDAASVVNLPAATGTGIPIQIKCKVPSASVVPDGTDTIDGLAEVLFLIKNDFVTLTDVQGGIWELS